MLRRMLHEIAHRLKWTHGYVVSAWSGDALWIGFECATCKRVTDVHVVEYRHAGEVMTKADRAPHEVWNR